MWAYEGETFGYRVIHVQVLRSGTLIALGLNSVPSDDQMGPLAASVYQTLRNAGLS